MKSVVLALCGWMLCMIYCQAQEGGSPDPGINDFVYVEEPPKPLNMTEVTRLIGYPDEARDKNVEGQVIARILVDERGKYVRHKILKTPDSVLSRAVAVHINKLTFLPAFKEGKPIKMWVNLPFSFRLKNAGPQEQLIAYYTQVLSEASDNYYAYFQRGLGYFELNKNEEALKDLDQAIKLGEALSPRPDSMSRMLYYMYFARGRTHATLSQWIETLADLGVSIGIGDTLRLRDSSVSLLYPTLLIERGYAYAQQKNHSAAVADYQKAIAEGPALACNTYQLIIESQLVLKNLKEVVENYDKLLECRPQDRLLRYSRGFYKMEAGDYLGAVADFQETARINTDSKIRLAAHNTAALAYLKAKKYPEALAEIDKALTVNVLNPLSYLYKAKVLAEQKATAATICDQLNKAQSYNLELDAPDSVKELEEMMGKYCPK